MRPASAVLAACAAAFAASDSSAGDAAPKPDAGKPLRLALENDKTYVYRLKESIVVRHELPNDVVRDIDLSSRAEVVWDVGVSLQRVEAGGDSIVSLLPTRVRGSFTELLEKPSSFDSDDPKSPATSPLLGRGIRVRLSPRGRVLEVEGRGDSPQSGLTPEIRAFISRLGGRPVRPFAEQFFHELPEEAPRKGLAWEQSRALAPEWTLSDEKNEVRGTCLGDVTENSVVQALAPDAVTATLRARGKRDVPRRDKPVDLTSPKLADVAELGDQLDEWLVLGEVKLRRDTGLVVSRTATYTLQTHSNPIRFPKDKGPFAAGGVEVPDVASGAERTHEITLQLELVDVR